MRALFALLLSSILILNGCVSLQLRDANAQLTQLYQTKAIGDDIAKLNAMASLAHLADESYSAAEKSRDVNNKIAFYRIALTAAWQAEAFDTIGQYTSVYSSLCEADKNTNRDCMMLLLFPDFAAIDAITRAIELQRNQCFDAHTKQHLANNTTACIRFYQSQLNHYESRINVLIDKWPIVQSSQADPLLASESARRLTEATCTHLRGVGDEFFDLTGSSAAVKAAQTRLKAQLSSIGIDEVDC